MNPFLRRDGRSRDSRAAPAASVPDMALNETQAVLG